MRHSASIEIDSKQCCFGKISFQLLISFHQLVIELLSFLALPKLVWSNLPHLDLTTSQYQANRALPTMVEKKFNTSEAL